MRVYLKKRNENIVAKGEISCFEQFFLCSQCFQKLSAAEKSESVCMRARVNVAFLLQTLHNKVYILYLHGKNYYDPAFNI